MRLLSAVLMRLALLEPGGVLSGQSNQLIVRTSPRNLAEIRAALDAIDTPARDGARADAVRRIRVKVEEIRP